MNSNRRLGFVLFLTLTCSSVFSQCSTLYSNWEQEPETNDQIDEVEIDDRPYALIKQKDWQLSIGVPLSGSERLLVGPCLFPILPLGREKPQTLQLYIYVQAQSTLEIRPADWEVEYITHFKRVKKFNPYRTHVYESSPGVDPLANPVKSSSHINGFEPIALPLQSRVHFVFSTFDNDFEKFVLRGAIIEGDSKRNIPSINFERDGDLSYTAYTTQWWDALE